MRLFDRLLILCLLFGLLVALSQKKEDEVNEEEIDEVKKLAKFQAWYFAELEKSGSKKPKLILAPSPIPKEQGENGIFAEENIAEDDFLLRVPYNLMITANRILEVTPIGDVLDVETIRKHDLNDTDIIAIYIMYLKVCNPATNPWTLWMDILPKRLNNILYFTEPELRHLDGSPIKEQALLIRTQAQYTFQILEKLFEEKQDKLCKITYNDWKWASSIVTSRKIELIDEHSKKFTTLIPYFDFFNHADFDEEKWSWGYKSDHKFFHVSAIKAVKKGHQIYQMYGPYSNAQLLINYGFILPKNSYNSVQFEVKYLGIDPKDELYETKERLLAEIRADPEKLLIMKDSMSSELFSAAQIINGDVDDFTEDGKLEKQLNPVIDFYIGQYFQAVLGHKLEQYPNTLKEDEDLMRTTVYTGMSARAQMAIAVRAEEKRILHNIVDFYAKKEHTIRSSYLQAKEEANKDEL